MNVCQIKKIKGGSECVIKGRRKWHLINPWDTKKYSRVHIRRGTLQPIITRTTNTNKSAHAHHNFRRWKWKEVSNMGLLSYSWYDVPLINWALNKFIELKETKYFFIPIYSRNRFLEIYSSKIEFKIEIFPSIFKFYLNLGLSLLHKIISRKSIFSHITVYYRKITR